MVGVCTENDEYLPLISPDGDYMFYTHRYRKKTKTNPRGTYVEEFLFSERLNDIDSKIDTFTTGTVMPPPFNQEGKNQGGVSITIDNKQLFITICELIHVGSTSYNNCDIYTAEFVNGSWTPLRNLGPNVNGNYTFEAQPSITANGKVLFFTSAREGCIGGLDIYRSVRDHNGNWGKAENLGPVINTEKDDKTPFIHADGETLYFASDGHFGLGGLDVFYAKFENRTWSPPVNLGYPVNTENDEFGMIVSTDGKKIYLSSNTYIGKGGLDIFSSTLHENALPSKVLFIKGKLFDENGNPLTNAKVELQNIDTKEVSEGFVDKNTGNYAVAITVKKKNEYILTAKKQGCIFSTKRINPNTKEFEVPTIIDMEVEPIKEGKIVKLDHVNFATNSTAINKAGKIVLEQLIDFMKDNLSVNIAIYGHTDNIGDERSNLLLSNRRAKAVRDYLIKAGIQTNRLTYKGFGETRPIASNNTDEGRAINRRTEFLIVSQ